jgi:diguanylate cyclase (GGDEF)-like protein/PAS domain S-box-containing protein
MDYEGRYRRLIENSTDAIVSVNLAGTVLEANAAIRYLLGYSPDEVIGTPVSRYLAPGEGERVTRAITTIVGGASNARADFEVITRDGERRVVDVVGYPILCKGRVGAVVAVARDITQRHEREVALAHQATHDEMTGLPNRVLLRDRLSHALARSQRTGLRVGVLMFDLDGFKSVNDDHRQHVIVGDPVLVGVAQSVAASLRSVDTVMRYGGDEFVVVVDEVTSVAELTLLAQRILDAVAVPITVAGHMVQVTASLGIAQSNEQDDTTSLLARADQAMYDAKDRRPKERAGYRGGWWLADD